MGISAFVNMLIELKEHSEAIPDLTINIHSTEFSERYQFIGAEVSITNISTSPFSITPLLFNGKDSLLTPYIWRRSDGRRNIRAYDGESRSPSRVILSNSSLAQGDCIAFPLYLLQGKTERGLVFWDWETEEPNHGKFSATIAATNKVISSKKVPLF